jgi:hypothetical protein
MLERSCLKLRRFKLGFIRPIVGVGNISMLWEHEKAASAYDRPRLDYITQLVLLVFGSRCTLLRNAGGLVLQTNEQEFGIRSIAWAGFQVDPTGICIF